MTPKNRFQIFDAGEIPAGSHGTIRASTVLDEKTSRIKIDLRLYVPSKDGRRMVPTKQGFRLDAALGSDLIATIRTAQTAADDLRRLADE